MPPCAVHLVAELTRALPVLVRVLAAVLEVVPDVVLVLDAVVGAVLEHPVAAIATASDIAKTNCPRFVMVVLPGALA